MNEYVYTYIHVYLSSKDVKLLLLPRSSSEWLDGEVLQSASYGTNGLGSPTAQPCPGWSTGIYVGVQPPGGGLVAEDVVLGQHAN